ncbi:MAG: methionine adenosyltransferase [Planctomycetes bacterium]|jgi:S-adenosylmethionine synthetase|nr:methionine adenosyltransferase [Planctomycetota bacterium]HON44355.1 methionine adenosyltransferase [Planctomycetota bacterium]HPY75308.1 methionine adenosyltransferase [Planctomycetota bacterium]HQB00916.1 methionine adenosyltransferase [Planctomycetota bacterium]HRU52086.1 methionine adenosyltransferase [Planctomycetota bacterium]
MKKSLFTSECVTMGHPDKIADQISDAILDALLEQDPNSRVACETLVSTGLVVLSGEITTNAHVDYPTIARRTIKEIGYNDSAMGFDARSCSVLVSFNQQSADIAMGVDEGENKEQGAGDQGIMFGYACKETEDLMPLPISLSRKLANYLAEVRLKKELEYLRPDGKTQVTVAYEDGKPVKVSAVVISTQHAADVSQETIRKDMIEKIIKVCIPSELLDEETVYHINPTGKFEIGGPHGDCGLTGRKIIVDTYGGMGRHGGGAFSGKDASKVDRSASYMARHIAKNIVAADLADRCEVQLAYAIGVAEPISIKIDTFDTGKIDEEKLVELIRANFPLKPKAIIDYLELRKPVFLNTARFGHFGGDDTLRPWEYTNKAEALRKGSGL